MSIKKKLSLGAMSAALGLSLVAGGTWAAFNDIEEVNASVAAGELNLKLKQAGQGPTTFSVKDLKPGDTMTRKIKLDNEGSLAIKEVLLSIDNINFTDYVPQEGQAGYGDTDTYGSNTAIEYLSQFKVTVAKVGAEGGSGGFPKDIILNDITLADLYEATAMGYDATKQAAARAVLTANVNPEYYQNHGLNVATMNPDKWTGLPVIPGDDDILELTIVFNEYSNRDARGVEEQNKYQGDKVDVEFSFEAKQWGGLDVQDSDLDSNGSVITNKKSYSEEGNSNRP